MRFSLHSDRSCLQKTRSSHFTDINITDRGHLRTIQCQLQLMWIHKAGAMRQLPLRQVYIDWGATQTPYCAFTHSHISSPYGDSVALVKCGIYKARGKENHTILQVSGEKSIFTRSHSLDFLYSSSWSSQSLHSESEGSVVPERTNQPLYVYYARSPLRPHIHVTAGNFSKHAVLI